MTRSAHQPWTFRLSAEADRAGANLHAAQEAPEMPCRAEPEAWFPHPQDHDAARLAALACLRCPVLAQCAELTTAMKPRHGVWAATWPENKRVDLFGDRAHAATQRRKYRRTTPEARASAAEYRRQWEASHTTESEKEPA